MRRLGNDLRDPLSRVPRQRVQKCWLRQVHHLTVAAYMLQHSSKLTLKGWLATRKLLREFWVENKSPAEVRRLNKSKVDSGKRDWKIASNDGIPKTDKTEWSKTILDVRLDNAEIYFADVTAWAKAALKESEEIAEDRACLIISFLTVEKIAYGYKFRECA